MNGKDEIIEDCGYLGQKSNQHMLVILIGLMIPAVVVRGLLSLYRGTLWI
jgi:hypothetical protein